MTDGSLMKVESIAECSPLEHSVILLTCIKRLLVLKNYFCFLFEWPLKTGFTVYLYRADLSFHWPSVKRSPVCALGQIWYKSLEYIALKGTTFLKYFWVLKNAK